MKEKFKDIVKDFGYLNEQNTTTGDFEVETIIQDKKEKVKINLGHSFNDVRPLDDVTISWGDKTYTVDFEFDETLEKAKDFETEDDRFDIDLYLAYSDDEEWKFEVEVQVYPRNDYGGYEYGKEGGTIIKDESAVMWNTLQINTVLSNLANFENKSNSIEEQDTDNNFTNNLEKEIKEKFNEYSRIREEKPGMYRVKFSFVRREFDDKVWDEMLEFITDKGFEIDEKMTSNYYEPNYDREEPPEAVPMIYFSTEEQDDFEKGFMTEMLQRRAGIIK